MAGAPSYAFSIQAQGAASLFLSKAGAPGVTDFQFSAD
jgi:hypothetical protein